MEMTYNNAMVLPKNFAAHTEDEMMYLDGGATKTISYKAISNFVGNGYSIYDTYGLIKWFFNVNPLTFAVSVGVSTLVNVLCNCLAARKGGVTITYSKNRITRGRRSGYAFNVSKVKFD